MSAQSFLETVKQRRSIHVVSKEEVVSRARVEEIVKEAVLHSPTAFNSQSGRAVVLFGEEHDKLWDIVSDTLRAIVPADQFGATEQRLSGFKGGYGTVLFFEDEAVVKSLQEQFALYADNFPIWSQQSSGMLQYVVWTALSAEGLGASLQHYNPLINEKVSQAWNIPSSWKLIAQLPFGKPTYEAGEKQFQPVEERVKVHG